MTTSKKLFANKTPPGMDFVDMGPGKAAWISKDWNPKLTLANVTMTMHGTEDFIVIAYHDPNGLTHLLTRWVDGSITFTWDWRENWLPSGKPGDPFKYFPGVEVTDENILRLASAWLEYLDAVIEVRHEAR